MKRSPASPPLISALLALLDEAYDKQAWHGPNLRGSLRGIEPAQAAWRPAAGRKNIWEIAVHAAYWKYCARRRLTGEKRGSFPLKGSNWFERPVAGSLREPSSGKDYPSSSDGTPTRWAGTPVPATLWRSDLALLDRMHRELRSVVAAFSPDKLLVQIANTKHTPLRLIQGIALHDVYHAGQIQTLKRLYGE